MFDHAGYAIDPRAGACQGARPRLAAACVSGYFRVLSLTQAGTRAEKAKEAGFHTLGDQLSTNAPHKMPTKWVGDLVLNL
jgi:hypothetical protein